LMDRDQVLPADGASLLAALDRKLSEPGGESATAARAGIEAFIGWMQALVEAGVIEAADGHARIEAAAELGALLPTADGTDPETRTRRGDT
jgi:hypothetical protein